MVLRRIFRKILQCIQHLGRILHLIENEQRLPLLDILPTRHRQIRKNTLHILRRTEEIPIFRILIKVEIGGIFIVHPPKFLQEPRLPHLTHALHDQGLPVRRVLPGNQLSHCKSFHCYHLFIYNYVTFLTLLYIIS